MGALAGTIGSPPSRLRPTLRRVSDLAENLASVRQRIAAACDRAARDPATVQLLAVSKKMSPDTVEAAAQLGLRLFGENRVQEAKAKIPLCPGHLRWHFIGHLQSNKCRDAAALFEMVHALDSLPLAEELNARCDQAARTLPVLLEINVSGESSKHGFSPETALRDLAAINALPHLAIHGLMTMAPWSSIAEKARPHFRKLRELRTRCEDALGAPLPELSMGMSGDFEVAIEEGTTLIRLGTALFGERKTEAID